MEMKSCSRSEDEVSQGRQARKKVRQARSQAGR